MDFPSQKRHLHSPLKAHIAGSCQATVPHPVQQKVTFTHTRDRNEPPLLLQSRCWDPVSVDLHQGCPSTGSPWLHPHPHNLLPWAGRAASSDPEPDHSLLCCKPGTAPTPSGEPQLPRLPSQERLLPSVFSAESCCSLSPPNSLSSPGMWTGQPLCPGTSHHLTFFTGHTGTPQDHF